MAKKVISKKYLWSGSLLLVTFAIVGLIAFYPGIVGTESCAKGWENLTEKVKVDSNYSAVARYYCNATASISRYDCMTSHDNYKGCVWAAKLSSNKKTAYIIVDPVINPISEPTNTTLTFVSEYNITSEGITNITWCFYNNISNPICNLQYDSTSLVGWWTFDNMSGNGENSTNAVNLVGGKNLTAQGGLTWSATKGRFSSGSFNFTGTNDTSTPRILIGKSPLNISLNQNWSYSVWFLENSYSHADAAHVVNPTYYSGWLKCYGTGCSININNGTDNSAGTFTNTYGTWNQMGITYDNYTAIQYANGNIIGTKIVPNARQASSDMYVGGFNSYGQYDNLELNGAVDDLFIYNRTLSPDEMAALKSMHLTKYNSSNYNIVEEQVFSDILNSTIPSQTYYYYICVTNSSGSQNCSTIKNATITISNVTISANYSNKIGTVRSNFYGTGLQSSKMFSGGLDINCDGTQDISRNYTWQKEAFLNGGNAITYYDASLGSYYNGVENPGFEYWKNDTVEWINSSMSSAIREKVWGWIFSGSNPNATALVSNSTDSHSGKYSLNITRDSTGNNDNFILFNYWGAVTHIAPFNKSHIYQASFWIKGNGTFGVGMENLSGSGCNTSQYTMNFGMGWNKYTTTCNITQDSSYAVYINGIGRNESLLVDDFSLTKDGASMLWWQTGDTSSLQNQLTWDYQNNITDTTILSYTPRFLALRDTNCTDTLSDADVDDCMMSDVSSFANLSIDYYQRIDQGRNYTMVEIWNEPYGGFFEDNLPPNSAKTDFVTVYNTTYMAFKSYNPSIKIVGYRDTSLDYFGGDISQVSPFTRMMWGNLSQEFQTAFSFHPYYSSGYILGTHKIQDALTQIFSNVNTSWILADEWQPNYAQRNQSNGQGVRYSAEVAYFYSSILNIYPANVSSMYYHWDDSVSYFNCPSRYAEYPSFWSGVSEAGLDNPTPTYYPPYNVTKDFSHVCPALADVYNSSASDSGIVTLSCMNGTSRNLIIINTGLSARIIINNSINQYTDQYGNNLTKSNGVIDAGNLDQFGLLYLTESQNYNPTVTLSSGISTIHFSPVNLTQQNLYADNETDSIGLFNISNMINGDNYNITMKIKKLQNGWQMECSPNISQSWTLLNLSYQTIYSGLSNGNTQMIWCRVDLNNPTSAWNGGISFNITT